MRKEVLDRPGDREAKRHGGIEILAPTPKELGEVTVKLREVRLGQPLDVLEERVRVLT